MTKIEFLEALKLKLSKLPKKELDDRLNFYSEMIDDRIEDGLSEEEALSKIGSADEIALEIVGNVPLGKIMKEALMPKRKLTGLEITLLIVCFPIWVSLLASAFAGAISLYASLWVVVVSLWAAFVSFIACGFTGIVLGAVYVIQGLTVSGVWLIGAGLVSLSLAIFSFYSCKITTRFSAKLLPKIVLWVKKLFIKKEKNND